MNYYKRTLEQNRKARKGQIIDGISDPYYTNTLPVLDGKVYGFKLAPDLGEELIEEE